MAIQKREYKLLVIQEGLLGTIFLHAGVLPASHIEKELNQYGKQGWSMDFMVVENRRVMLFWNREAAIITLSRPL